MKTITRVSILVLACFFTISTVSISSAAKIKRGTAKSEERRVWCEAKYDKCREAGWDHCDRLSKAGLITSFEQYYVCDLTNEATCQRSFGHSSDCETDEKPTSSGSLRDNFKPIIPSGGAPSQLAPPVEEAPTPSIRDKFKGAMEPGFKPSQSAPPVEEAPLPSKKWIILPAVELKVNPLSFTLKQGEYIKLRLSGKNLKYVEKAVIVPSIENLITTINCNSSILCTVKLDLKGSAIPRAYRVDIYNNKNKIIATGPFNITAPDSPPPTITLAPKPAVERDLGDLPEGAVMSRNKLIIEKGYEIKRKSSSKVAIRKGRAKTGTIECKCSGGRKGCELIVTRNIISCKENKKKQCSSRKCILKGKAK